MCASMSRNSGVRAMPTNASISVSGVGRLEGFKSVKAMWGPDVQDCIRFVVIDGTATVATVIFSDAATAQAMIADLAAKRTKLNGRVPTVKRLNAAEDEAATQAAEKEIADRMAGRYQRDADGNGGRGGRGGFRGGRGGGMPTNASISISGVGRLEGFKSVKAMWGPDVQDCIRFVVIDGTATVATVIFSDAATAQAMIADLAAKRTKLNGRVPTVKRLNAAEDEAATQAAEKEIADRMAGRHQAVRYRQ